MKELRRKRTYVSQAGDLGYSLAFHCAPTIEGIKVANLVSLKKERYTNFAEAFREYAAMLHQKGIYFYKLDECPERVLLLVYNRELLTNHLAGAEQAAFLAGYGYTREMTLYRMLQRLQRRMNRCGQGDYPHEIGVFLGYPLADVQGFIHHEGAAYQLCGYWKVYQNPAQAKQTFRTYDTLRNYYCTQLSEGETIHTIHLGGIRL